MKGKKVVKQLKCDTVYQFIAYTWIKNHFMTDHIYLALYDKRTIILKAYNDYAYVRFKNEEIHIQYSENLQSIVEVFPFKRPYHHVDTALYKTELGRFLPQTN